MPVGTGWDRTLSQHKDDSMSLKKQLEDIYLHASFQMVIIKTRSF